MGGDVALLWRDENQVIENRALYRRKFDLAEAALSGRYGFYRPAGGFFLWLDVGDGEQAALRLWRDAAIRSAAEAAIRRARRMVASTRGESIFASRSSMTRRRSTPRLRGSAGCCNGTNATPLSFGGKIGAGAGERVAPGVVVGGPRHGEIGAMISAAGSASGSIGRSTAGTSWSRLFKRRPARRARRSAGRASSAF